MTRVVQALPVLMCLVGCGEIASLEKRADAGTTLEDAAVGANEAATRRDARTEVGTEAGGRSCPTSQPSVGGRCTTSLACEYGSDPSIECDTLMGCASGVWAIASVPFDAGCGKTNSATCPATFSKMLEGATCTGNLECYYPEARCWCLPAPCPGLGCPAPNTWSCDVAFPDAGCPEPRPRLGTPCSASEQGLLCSYADPCRYLLCQMGVWQLSSAGCGK